MTKKRINVGGPGAKGMCPLEQVEVGKLYILGRVTPYDMTVRQLKAPLRSGQSIHRYMTFTYTEIPNESRENLPVVVLAIGKDKCAEFIKRVFNNKLKWLETWERNRTERDKESNYVPVLWTFLGELGHRVYVSPSVEDENMIPLGDR